MESLAILLVVPVADDAFKVREQGRGRGRPRFCFERALLVVRIPTNPMDGRVMF